MTDAGGSGAATRRRIGCWLLAAAALGPAAVAAGPPAEMATAPAVTECEEVVRLLAEIAALQRLEVVTHELVVQVPVLGALWTERGRVSDRLEKARTAVVYLTQQEADSRGLGTGDRLSEVVTAQLEARREEVRELQGQIQRIDLQIDEAEEAIERLRDHIATLLPK